MQGRENSGFGQDYRKKSVLATWKYIPQTEWGVVTKIDEDEVLAPIRDFRKTMFILVIAEFIILGLMIYFVAKTIPGNIESKSIGEEEDN